MALKNFNVLIGRNNSGKSNILDCLSFISEITTNPVDRALGARGGYDHVIYGGDIKGKIRIEILLKAKRKDVRYTILFDKDKIIQEEALDVSLNLVLLNRTETTATLFNEKKQQTFSLGLVPTVAALMQFVTDPNLRENCPTLAEVIDFLRNWKFYKLNPSNLRTASDPRKEYDIGKDGKSMPLVLHTLVSANLPVFKEIEKTLKSAIPEIEELQSPLTEDGKTHVAIKEKSFKNAFDHHQLSDGTLSILAHLLVVFSPSQARLIGIEEPEDYVHPKLLKFLVDVLKASKTQTIIVTHSPYLLDVVEPENFFIIKKIQGKTTSKVPRKKELAKFLEKFSLGELWVSGELENAQ
jgi:predicted ATPase